MRREHADDRHARAARRPPGHRQLQPVGAGAGDDPPVVEDGMHPLVLQDRGEPLDVVHGRRPAEVVADRADRGAVLLDITDGADAVRPSGDPRRGS